MARRLAGLAPVEGLDLMPEFERPWIWQVIPGYLDSAGYRWVTRNRVMHNDETGVTIRYRPRQQEDVICGARGVCPGFPRSHVDDGRGIDYTQPYDVVCNLVGDHGELPHVGAPAACADMTCRCKEFGSYHLVIVGVTIKRPELSTWETV